MLYPSKTNSLPLVIAAFLLVTIAAATAHGKVEVVKIQSGAETAEGVLDKEAAAVRGNTFTLNSIDPGESRHLTVAFDYVPLGLAPTNIPIVGGTWTMVIIRKGEYYRTIYGVVERGEILGSTRFCPEEPPAGPLPKSVILDLRSTGVLGDDAAYFSFTSRSDIRWHEYFGTCGAHVLEPRGGYGPADPRDGSSRRNAKRRHHKDRLFV